MFCTAAIIAVPESRQAAGATRGDDRRGDASAEAFDTSSEELERVSDSYTSDTREALHGHS
jgi:hypothetical protein